MAAEHQENQMLDEDATASEGAKPEPVADKAAAKSDAEPESAPTDDTAAQVAGPDDSALQALRDELDASREQALRAQAEVQNIRRRAERDVENAHKFALERFAGALLPVVDNLERALAAMDPQEEHTRPLVEGIELTHRSFSEVLRRFGISVVDPEGEPFDPSCHEAMSMIENDEVEANTVLQVIQKGYTLNGRVLRAAMVIVSRPAPAAKVDETV